MQIADFVEKWNKSGAAERANKDSYLRDLCDVLGVPHPEQQRNRGLNSRIGFA
jgi:hypothetical protein